MSPLTAQPNLLWPLLLYAGAVGALIAAMLGVSWILGQHHRNRTTGEPFESGVMPVGSARLRLSAKFYLVAIFFVIFDLEVVFIFAWGIAVKAAGWPGYTGAMIFIGILAAALIYEWRNGALDWGPQHPRTRSRAGEP